MFLQSHSLLFLYTQLGYISRGLCNWFSPVAEIWLMGCAWEGKGHFQAFHSLSLSAFVGQV